MPSWFCHSFILNEYSRFQNNKKKLRSFLTHDIVCSPSRHYCSPTERVLVRVHHLLVFTNCISEKDFGYNVGQKNLVYLGRQNKIYQDVQFVGYSILIRIHRLFFKYSFEMKSNERWFSATEHTIYKIDGRKDRRRVFLLIFTRRNTKEYDFLLLYSRKRPRSSRGPHVDRVLIFRMNQHDLYPFRAWNITSTLRVIIANNNFRRNKEILCCIK